MYFVGNLFLSTSCGFYYHYVIVMTSLALRSAVFYPPVFFHNSMSVKQLWELPKIEQVQQNRPF